MGPEAAEDRALVARCAEGDRSALSALYGRYAPRLLAIGVRILHERREAEDVLHDVFLEAWKQAHRYDPERGSVAAWLSLRMRSRSLDRVRSAQRSRSVPLSEEPASLDPSTESSPEQAPMVHALREAMLALPEEQARVVLLAYFRGLSSTEIAKTLDIPVGTTKSRMAAAMSKLREALGEGENA